MITTGQEYSRSNVYSVGVEQLGCSDSFSLARRRANSETTYDEFPYFDEAGHL